MSFRKAALSPTKKAGPNKFVLGFAALAATAVVGTTGMAAAAQNTAKPTKQECAAAGYKNYGQCVKQWAQDKQNPGSGYGGNTANVNVNLDVSGDNNTVSFIINLFR